MSTENRDYWLSRDGGLYADQQKVRRDAGNANYGLQESWLIEFLRTAAAERGAPVRVLDYGVGFGRMTRLLAEYDFVDYYGFDISAPMVEPLLSAPPSRYASDIRDRIMVGSDLPVLAGSRQFDVIFTVSVMIHNSPEQAREVIEGMRAVLAPGGCICLIENRPVAISMLGNLWHAGCWSHDFANTTANDMDVDVDDGILADHGIYFLREPRPGALRSVRVPGSNGFEVIDRPGYLVRSHENTVAAVRGLENEINVGGSQLAELRDAVELYKRAEEHANKAFNGIAEGLPAALREKVGPGHLIDVLELVPALATQLRERDLANRVQVEELHAEFEHRLAEQRSALEQEEVRIKADHAEQVERYQWQLGLRERLSALMSTDHEEPAYATSDLRNAEPNLPVMPSHLFQFDAPRDTRFAQELSGHERVCHVMHQEWFGIRAAAGALPGHKLAVSATDRPSALDIEAVAKLFQQAGVDRIAIHGFSTAMAAWIKGFAGAGFNHIYLVWHGAPVMWVHNDERRFFALALDLARQGYIKRIQGMRGGSHAAIGPLGWPQQIYNMPPNYRQGTPRHQRRHEGAIAFSPSWNLVHKNLASNVAGAVASDQVDTIWVLANDFQLPYPTEKKIEVLPKLDQVQIMDTMSLADVVLNASVVDCHPMVELEALAVGTPSVRGRLGMDALEDHEYVSLTQVGDALNVRDIARTISRVLSTPDMELEQMMASYSRQLIELSSARYTEFMEL
ncbi:methyltransferase domain-containing protein [Stenotrophomonas rhizophila]|jgi:SAM-dependent methyltransferase|uniref:methyltransferase domain-containing protein n=1 Tax=Stenotrophomonas rhizophila TaxID=216778 RepID=UPI000B88B3D1|nr:methyltransferase domain-containing protein [Stenotrophomonas rhizophila]